MVSYHRPIQVCGCAAYLCIVSHVAVITMSAIANGIPGGIRIHAEGFKRCQDVICIGFPWAVTEAQRTMTRPFLSCERITLRHRICRAVSDEECLCDTLFDRYTTTQKKTWFFKQVPPHWFGSKKAAENHSDYNEHGFIRSDEMISLRLDTFKKMMDAVRSDSCEIITTWNDFMWISTFLLQMMDATEDRMTLLQRKRFEKPLSDTRKLLEDFYVEVYDHVYEYTGRGGVGVTW